MPYELGFDIGGTFTDIFVRDKQTGRILQEKVPTTPNNLSAGVVNGIEKVCSENNVPSEEIERLSHGTTVATNALLERDGATTGLITTEGFRDIVAIAREKRSDIYNYSPSKLDPFTDRKHRIGVPERLSADGEERTPVDENAVHAAIDELKDSDVESVAVCFLHSYRDDKHEQQVHDMIEAKSALPVSLSSEVMPEIKEYERSLMTTLNAYVAPLVDSYIEDLSGKLADLGLTEQLRIMQANGGVVTPQNLDSRSIQLVNSGPAAGVLGAAGYAAQAGIDNIITMDMGGTSADASVVRDGEPETTTEGEIDEVPLLFPQIDVRTVGAGGGSIAYLDDADVLKVGPRSAGAQPGPACYGRGGTEPTVTDAALALGYLNPDYFLGGEMALDVASAEAALTSIADNIGRDLTAVADGILDIVTTDMMQAIRLVTVEKGYDPRSFALTCYGGAGPLFATRLARSLNIDTTLIPAAPGVLSASGLLSADERFDFSMSRPLAVGDATPATVASIFNELEEDAHDIVGSDAQFARSVDMRYEGQTFQLNVEFPDGDVTAETIDAMVERFYQEYEAIYGTTDRETPTEVMTWRLRATTDTASVDTQAARERASVDDAVKTTRDVYVDGEFVEHTVYDRYVLPPKSSFEGPAIIEETESTTIAGPDSSVETDQAGNLLLRHR